MNNKQKNLDQIKTDIIKNNVCPNLAQDAKNLVMGDGNIDAEIVFIGEAPGKKEDETGLPFVGSAGKFLNELLAEANINREDVFITNIVKYRPPKNRDPLPDEKKAFWPYLVRQLDVIKPKIIITLGRHSMEYFLPNQKISLVHGKMNEALVDDIKFKIIPMYHPAAAIYNRKLRQIIINDFKKMINILQKENK